MAYTYTQIYLHTIFAVKNRNSLVPPIYLPRIHAYMSGILRNHGHHVYAIGGIDSHVHVMIGYNCNQSIPDMIRDLKSATARYINEQHLIPYKFEWQKGYGCFSYSKSHVESVCNYINHQYEHHKSISLTDEIRSIMDKFGVKYDARYTMHDPE